MLQEAVLKGQRMKNVWIWIFICISSLYGCSQKSVSLEEALWKQEMASETVQITDSEPVSETVERLEQTLVYVYVCGAVKHPGVYALEQGSRIVSAIEAAGGFLEEAVRERVNLAQVVSDGMQITIPDISQAMELQTEQQEQKDGRVNLNRASVDQLCTLSGIGESKAKAIIAYREEIGGFTSLEQIQNVTGIGEKLFKQIQENIYIE